MRDLLLVRQARHGVLSRSSKQEVEPYEKQKQLDVIRHSDSGHSIHSPGQHMGHLYTRDQTAAFIICFHLFTQGSPNTFEFEFES